MACGAQIGTSQGYKELSYFQKKVLLRLTRRVLQLIPVLSLAQSPALKAMKIVFCSTRWCFFFQDAFKFVLHTVVFIMVEKKLKSKKYYKETMYTSS
jgi:hypothetical protein